MKEGFLEASIPWREGQGLDGTGRAGTPVTATQTTTTVKPPTRGGFRLGWAFNQQIKARASYQRAVRAPNVQELFQLQASTCSIWPRPCSNGSPGGLRRRLHPGPVRPQWPSSADDWGKDPDSPAGQYNYLQGGNPDLSPEESDTYTYGVVLTPTLEGFTLTVDYDIKIEDGINNLSQEFILTECLEGNTSQCDKVKRGNNERSVGGLQRPEQWPDCRPDR